MSIREDFRFAGRTLLKSPAFALTAVLTIALGIGASTSIFSLVNAVLLRSLPYANPERLVFVQSDLTARDVRDFPLPPGDFPDLVRGAPAFSEVAAVITDRSPMTTETGDTEMVSEANVTTNFIRTLGGRIVRGRDFVEADGSVPPPPPENPNPGAAPPDVDPPIAMTILSNEFWQRRFGGDPNVVGKTFKLGRQTAEIIGVLAPGFEVLWPTQADIEAHPDFYSALRVDFTNGSRVNVFLRVVARLKPGATIEQAQQQVNLVVNDIRKRFPIKETAGLRWRVEPMRDYLVTSVRPALVALMGAVTFVLLIACANVANLLLVRASQRERELAVRAALGSRRWELIRQMLVESLVVSATGGALGLGLAWAGMKLLVANGPDNLPRLEHVGIDPLVLIFTIIAILVSAMIFGVVPALRASRVNLADTLRSGGRDAGLSGTGRFLRNSVVVTEVALAFVLLVGSGLMIRSFIALQRADPGFDADGVLAFMIPDRGGRTPEERQARAQLISERLRAIPSVTGVASAAPLPLEDGASLVRWGLENALTDPTKFKQAEFRIVGPGYFEVMRTPVIEGRAFTAAENRPNTRMAVIDDVFARKAFPGQSALGQRFLARATGPEPVWYEVIGIVRQQRNGALASETRETIYLSDGEFGFGAANRWVVRTSTSPSSIAQRVQSEVKAIDRSLVVADLRPLSELVDQARAPTRFALACIGLFAVIAAVLASVGLYGVLSTAVRQRTPEIGVRIAFGASANSVFGLVVKQGVGLSLAGIGLGAVAALGLTRLMQSMLIGVAPTDALTYTSIALLFLGIATLACWIPARRAARLDPVVALRDG
jgi:predicted permease